MSDHPHTDPGDGRSECMTCGKWVWLVTHSCKGVPVTRPAIDRMKTAQPPCPGTCAHAQANKARALELKRVRDEFRTFIADLDAAGMKTVALGINDILEGK